MNIPFVSMKRSRWYRFFYGMFNKVYLYDYEKLCFDAWYERLSEPSQRIVDLQIKSLKEIAHITDGFKNRFFYHESSGSPKLPLGSDETKLATVYLRDQSGTGRVKVMRVTLTAFKGRFFSIDFPKSPYRYEKKFGMDLTQLVLDHVEIHVKM